MKTITTTLLFMFVSAIGSMGQDLIYRPINPAFGGDPFNYQWMLSSAVEQNRFQDDADTFNDPLADFEENLNRQIINQLSRELIGELFGEDGDIQQGTFEIGSFRIDVAEGLEGVNIDILNTLDGGRTTIVVPL